MNNIEKQVLIGSTLGDGHISKNKVFSTGSKYREWIDYKSNILKSYRSDKWYYFNPSNGYNRTPYHSMRLLVHKDITNIYKMSLQKKLDNLDDLGIAVWFYDDGSLHKNKLFYNLNTHSFTKKEHVECIIPFFKKFNIQATLTSETKKDGRKFWYIRINKASGGAEIVNKILKKYPISCYKYKTYKNNINSTVLKNKMVAVVTKNGTKLCKSVSSGAIYAKCSVTTILKSIKTQIPYKGYKFYYYFYVFNDQSKDVGLSSSKREALKSEDMV